MKKVPLFVGLLLVVLVMLGMFMNVREGARNRSPQLTPEQTAIKNAIQDDLNFLVGVRNHTKPDHNAGKKLREITYKDHKTRIDNDIVKSYLTGASDVIINGETNVVDAINILVKRRDAV